MDEQNESFSYTYSAKQQEEVKRIRQKYIPPEADKLEQLRRLDESATRPGRIVSLAVGIISTLILGWGCAAPWSGRSFLCRGSASPASVPPIRSTPKW